MAEMICIEPVHKQITFRSEPLKEHLNSMEACREFTSTTTTTTTTTEVRSTTTKTPKRPLKIIQIQKIFDNHKVTDVSKAATTTTSVEPIEESAVSEEDLGEDLGQDTKVLHMFT